MRNSFLLLEEIRETGHSERKWYQYPVTAVFLLPFTSGKSL